VALLETKNFKRRSSMALRKGRGRMLRTVAMKLIRQRSMIHPSAFVCAVCTGPCRVWSLLHLVSCCCSDRVWSVKRVCMCSLHLCFNLISTSLPVKMDRLTGDEVWICLVASPSRGVQGKSKAPQYCRVSTMGRLNFSHLVDTRALSLHQLY